MANTTKTPAKYIIMLDTETANTMTGLNGRPVMDYVLPYDVGIRLIKWYDFSVVGEWSFVIREIYLGEKELMQSAYYADKLPRYHEDLMNGQRTMVNAWQVKKLISDLCKEYNVVAICAHNARFDYNALNNLDRWVTKSQYRYFLPYGVEIWDTLKAARQVVGAMPSYKKFCVENGYLTKNNQLRYTAEILYQFIIHDTEFVESHTGLEDVKIEMEILRYIKRQKKKVDYKLWKDPEPMFDQYGFPVPPKGQKTIEF